MLAYSSVAHAGFILAGSRRPNTTGIRAAMFYLIAYAAMTLGAFGVVMLVRGAGPPSRRPTTTTRARRAGAPGWPALLTLFLLSLAGIPPTVGFIAKVTVFGAAIQAGNWPLVVVVVLASVVAAFFYLRVIVLMYFRQRAGPTVVDDRSVVAAGGRRSVLAVAVVVLGRVPAAACPGIIEQASILRW